MRFITTLLPDDVHPECVEHQNTSVVFCVSRLRRDRTFLAPLPFQAQSGHTEAHGECRWGSPHFMSATNSPFIACSRFRAVEGRLLCLARANLKIQLFAWPRKNQGSRQAAPRCNNNKFAAERSGHRHKACLQLFLNRRLLVLCAGRYGTILGTQCVVLR